MSRGSDSDPLQAVYQVTFRSDPPERFQVLGPECHGVLDEETRNRLIGMIAMERGQIPEELDGIVKDVSFAHIPVSVFKERYPYENVVIAPTQTRGIEEEL